MWEGRVCETIHIKSLTTVCVKTNMTVEKVWLRLTEVKKGHTKIT